MPYCYGLCFILSILLYLRYSGGVDIATCPYSSDVQDIIQIYRNAQQLTVNAMCALPLALESWSSIRMYKLRECQDFWVFIFYNLKRVLQSPAPMSFMIVTVYRYQLKTNPYTFLCTLLAVIFLNLQYLS